VKAVFFVLGHINIFLSSDCNLVTATGYSYSCWSGWSHCV